VKYLIGCEQQIEGSQNLRADFLDHTKRVLHVSA
jgi:hypothetical protein